MSLTSIEQLSAKVALAASLLVTIAARAQAQVVVNTDIRLVPSTAVEIIDQRAPEVYDDGTIVDSRGVPVVIEITTLNIDTLFTNVSAKSDFQGELSKAAAQGLYLGVALEPAGNCSLSNDALLDGVSLPYVGPGSEIFLILAALKNAINADLQANLASYEAIVKALIPYYLPLSPSLTLTVENRPSGGELKIQTPANVTQLLTSPRQKVDLIVAWNDGAGPAPDLNTGLNLFDKAACVTVTPNVTVVPAPSVNIGPSPS